MSAEINELINTLAYGDDLTSKQLRLFENITGRDYLDTDIINSEEGLNILEDRLDILE